MLPAALPVIPGLELTAAYRPAAVDARVGGDWYDVFELVRGKIALVIGDVVGRGVEAGALMAQVRTALRAYALEGHPPADVVDLLNRMFASIRPVRLTTLAYIVLDPPPTGCRSSAPGTCRRSWSARTAPRGCSTSRGIRPSARSGPPPSASRRYGSIRAAASCS